MNHLMRLETTAPPLLMTLTLLCIGLLPRAQAVVPGPDGGYLGGNTAEGQNALLSLSTGIYNTAIGLSSLRSNTTGQLNTAIGAATLIVNTADQNTATGAGALFSNTTGTVNTANGAFALFSNTTGVGNTANGQTALANNTTGSSNTANGIAALVNNTTGSLNIALGNIAGSELGTGNHNIDIGNIGDAADGETIRIGDSQTATYIAGISGQTASGGVAVYVNTDGKLGTLTSSARFKDDIKPMDKGSEAILALKPVTFRYKRGIDPKGIQQFGLVAEDVQKVNPDLVVRDKEGKPYSVRYEQVNAMLLNEFLKEHHQVQDLKATVAEQQKQIEALTAGLQKVSAQIELSKPAAQTAQTNR